MLTTEGLAELLGTTVPSVRGMILKMTNKCLISEDVINGKACFFYPDTDDKKKTLRYIQERIDLLKR